MERISLHTLSLLNPWQKTLVTKPEFSNSYVYHSIGFNLGGMVEDG